MRKPGVPPLDDEAPASGLGYRLELGVTAQLAEDGLDVVARRHLGDRETPGDDLRRETLGEELEHLALASGERDVVCVIVVRRRVAVVQHVEDRSNILSNLHSLVLLACNSDRSEVTSHFAHRSHLTGCCVRLCSECRRLLTNEHSVRTWR